LRDLICTDKRQQRLVNTLATPPRQLCAVESWMHAVIRLPHAPGSDFDAPIERPALGRLIARNGLIGPPADHSDQIAFEPERCSQISSNRFGARFGQLVVVSKFAPISGPDGDT